MIITGVKDLDDAIKRDSTSQSDLSAGKKQGNKSGIYQEKKTPVTGRRGESNVFTTLLLVKQKIQKTMSQVQNG